MILEMVRDNYLMALKGKMEKAKESYQTARKDTIEAEGRMITRYDSTKTETAWLADGYLQEVKILENYILDFENGVQIANIGDNVVVSCTNKQQNSQKTEYTLVRQSCINESLLFAILGRKVSESFYYKNENEYGEYFILDIIPASNRDNAERYVKIGSLVELEYEDDESEWYFLVNKIGGVELQIEDKTIFCISQNAPLSEKILGLNKNDSVYFRQKIKIKEII